MKRRFKILPSDVVKSLVEFLDEVQFDAAKQDDDKDAMHKINFCNWAIQELLNSHDGIIKGYISGKDFKPKDKPSKPSLNSLNIQDNKYHHYPYR